MKDKVYTFDSYFNEYVSTSADVENIMKLLQNKDIFIDEYSTWCQINR